MSTLTVEVLTPEQASDDACARMTFPAYRHLLSLQPTVRHPGQGDRRLIQPIAISARHGATLVGLVLAERPVSEPKPAELLSVFVTPEDRGQGVGTALVDAVEQHLRAASVARVECAYTTGQPGIPAFERVLEKRRWSPPDTRAISVRFTPEEALSTPWFGRVRLPDTDYRIFSWTELTEQDKAELVQTHTASPWIAKGLEPWRHDHYGYDQVSSVGLRYQGHVVGWVINHRMTDDSVRFTCSFVRGDLSRRGRIFPLYTESLRRLLDTGCRTCTLVTPVHYVEMAAFLKRRCVKWVSHVAESRGSSKPLDAGHP